MTPLVAGFWGAFFGAAALMALGSLLAFIRTRHRVPLRAALMALLSALFAAAYLGVLPVADPGAEQRVLAHVAALSFALLALLLLALLGLNRPAEQGRRAAAMVWGLAALVVLVGWTLQPHQALVMSSLVTIVVGLAALGLTGRSALRGDRLAWVAFAGIFFVNVALVALTWIALEQVRAWPLHAVSAVSGIAYLAAFSAAVWTRYSYLLELREVLAHGPSYDPVTRMRSHAETGQLVGAAFSLAQGEPRPIGVIVISIGNLWGLEKLHGRGAANHALFVCASRLRRCVPANVEMGRLGQDGFLLLAREHEDPARLVEIARVVAQRMVRPVSLSTVPDPAAQEGRAIWVADVGVGVLAAASGHIRPSTAVTMARAMSHTAWSYASRIAWFDDANQQIAELPLTDGH